METEFLFNCKELYFKDIHPFDFEKLRTEEYQKVLKCGKSIIEEKGLQNFLSFLMESQYRVNIWTAYLGLEYGNPNTDENLEILGKGKLIDYCFNVIKAREIDELSVSIDKNKDNWIKEQKAKFS